MNRLLAVVIIAVTAASAAIAQRPTDGMVVARAPYVPEVRSYLEFLGAQKVHWQSDSQDPSFDEQQFRKSFSEANYRLLTEQKAVRAERIVYMSDGLRIVGFIVRPAPDGHKHPVLFYARGGNSETGKLDDRLMVDFAAWARRGYIVLASQNRGGGGSEGKDEFGGDDVHDFENLVPVARTIADADTSNAFAYGHSRGTITLLEALRDGLPVRAAAVSGTVAALGDTGRPEMDKAFARMMPDYAQEKANGYCRRSALCWPEKIGVPLLLLSGGADWRAPVMQTLKLAESLQARKLPYELAIYEGDDHRLGRNRVAAMTHIIDWFDRYRSAPAAR